MKFETPKIVINAFSENIVTAASDIKIEDSQTVSTVKTILTDPDKAYKVNNILTFTFGE